MPHVNPVGGLTTNSVPLMSAALGSIATGLPEEARVALAAVDVWGEGRQSAYSSVRVRGITSGVSSAVVDAGVAQEAASLAAVDAGVAQEEPGLGAVETSGTGLYVAGGTVEVGDSGESGGSQKRYGATLASADVGGNPLAPALGGILLRSQTTKAALAAITQRQDRTLAVLGSIATVISGVQGGSLGAVDAGQVQEREALGSVDVEKAEGVQIIIDVVDEIVAGARGDVC